jgi:hypothetical protein
MNLKFYIKLLIMGKIELCYNLKSWTYLSLKIRNLLEQYNKINQLIKYYGL